MAKLQTPDELLAHVRELTKPPKPVGTVEVRLLTKSLRGLMSYCDQGILPSAWGGAKTEEPQPDDVDSDDE